MTNAYNIDLDKSRCVRGYPTIYICWPNPESSNLLNLNHQVAEVMEKSTKNNPRLVSLENLHKRTSLETSSILLQKSLFFTFYWSKRIMKMNDRHGFSIQTAFLDVADEPFLDGTKY